MKTIYLTLEGNIPIQCDLEEEALGNLIHNIQHATRNNFYEVNGTNIRLDKIIMYTVTDKLETKHLKLAKKDTQSLFNNIPTRINTINYEINP